MAFAGRTCNFRHANKRTPATSELGPNPCWASTQPFNYGGVLGRRISVPPKSVMPALVSRRNFKQIPAVGFQGKVPKSWCAARRAPNCA